MESRASVRVGIIGCGRISGHHCKYVSETEGAEIVAVCDLIHEKAKAYGDQFEIPVYVDYREMLVRHPEINVVVVATPSGMHFEHAFEILKDFRRNVVVEKPTFMRLQQLDEAYDLANKLGLNIFPVFQNRHNKAVQRVVTGIRNGELGRIRIMSVRVRWCRPDRYYQLAPWRGTYAMDGGALTNQGIHHIDLLRFLGGEVERVNCSMRTLGASIEVEDTVVANMHYQDGKLGVLEITTAARPIDFEASLSLVCENGLAQLGGIAVNELQVFTPSPDDCAPYSEDFSGCVYGYGHQKTFGEIVRFFREGIPYSVSGEDCRNTIQLLQSFYCSFESGDWTTVQGAGDSTLLGRSDEELANIYRTPHYKLHPVVHGV